MSSKARKGKVRVRPLTLKEAFEAESVRREMEQRKRDEAERRQQEEDLARAEQLFEAIKADPGFLHERELVVDLRRYTVSIDHRDYRVAAYFEAGKASVTSADKRTASTSTAAPRKQVTVDTVDEALAAMAQFLVDESR